MRALSFFLLLFAVVADCFYHDTDVEYDDAPDFDEFGYNELHTPEIEIRNLANPGAVPRTAGEMVARFNADFLRLLAAASPTDWTRLMAVMHPNAYIETCMEPSFILGRKLFQKWVTYLSKYYTEVGMKSSTITDQSDLSVSSELVYRTEIRGGAKGTDKWAMTASFDPSKGHFVIDTLNMVSDCTNIPKTPPDEPSIAVETFIEQLKDKLVHDIFLDDSFRYKSAYESMFEYLSPEADISVCDVGTMNPTQLVEYWYKRYGKVTHYKDHQFEVTKNENHWHVDFSVTFEGEKKTFYRDKYRFTVQKYLNIFIEYFANIMDWKITNVSQNCTENMTKMSKSDSSLVQMSLASRRWDQLFAPELQWNTHEAFLELFDHKTFNGYACGGASFDSFEPYVKWTIGLKDYYQKSIPQETKVYAYQGNKIGFYIINRMTAKDNSTTDHKVYFEGYYKDDRWILNHNGFSCGV